MSGLSTRAQQAISGDPRRPSDAVPYKPPTPQEGEKPLPNGFLLLAMGCGMLTMLMKIRWMAFVGLIFLASAVATADRTFEYTQLMQTSMFIITAIFTSYILPLWMQYKSSSLGTSQEPQAHTAAVEAPFT